MGGGELRAVLKGPSSAAHHRLGPKGPRLIIGYAPTE